MIRFILKFRTIFLCSLTIYGTYGCSAVTTGMSLTPYPQEGWEKIEENNWGNLTVGKFYVYKHTCDTGFVLVREVLITSYGSFGPPLLPVIPIPANVANKDFLIHILLTKTDVSLPLEPPNIAIKQSSSDTALAPAKVTRVWTFTDREYYAYQFDLEQKNIQAFTLFFLSKAIGCTVPSLNFKLNRNTVYTPLTPIN